MKPKVSVVIPHWPRTDNHAELLQRCVQSIPEGSYEKIIVFNDGTGMGKAINDGFRLAGGDYLLTMSNDIQWLAGNIEDLCDPEAVCIPDHLDGQWENPRCFYCIPRNLWEKVGEYDEQFEVGFFEDDDWMHRLALAGIPVKTKRVNAHHVPGQTLDKLPNRQELMDKNREIFIKKWGSPPNEL